jgi:hypothetical protein
VDENPFLDCTSHRKIYFFQPGNEGRTPANISRMEEGISTKWISLHN